MRKNHSRFLSLSAALLVTAFVPAGRAQTGTQTTVLASPSGPWFAVDGTVYFNAMSAFWPVGSVHTLSIPQGSGFSSGLDGLSQYQFQNWSWAGSSSQETSVQVIASPSVTQYTAAFNVQYLLQYQVACNPAPCTGVPGEAGFSVQGWFNGPNGSLAVWQSPGASTVFSVYVNPGWLLEGWQVGNSPLVASPTYSLTLNAPTTVTAVFIPAAPVTLVTNPPNLNVYADGSLMNTPSTLEWGLGTSHLVSGLNLTNDNTGKQWVFASWSDGGAQSHSYVVGNTPAPETVTATYAAAATPLFLTSPINLNLVVDGQVLPPPYSYIWGVGSTHTVAATTPQTDAQGNAWAFQSWDDGVTTPARTITIPVGPNDRLTALYSQQATLTVNSTIAGQAVTVDGSPCTTPCTVTRKPGAQVHVSAPASVPLSSSSRQAFLGWSTGGGATVAGDWIGALNTASTSITATYHLMNSLTVTASPSKGAALHLSPTSPDGFYDSQTKVVITVTPRPGYRFSSWSGDLSGSSPSGSLTMNVPHSAVAELAAAPYISRGGVNNGAGMGVQSGVAPGSVASIFGDSLAAGTAVGPANPLARTLAGATVHIGTRSLPLYLASPTQINFQIPPDYDPPIHNEDLYKIRDHTQWIIKMAFAQNAKSSKATKP